MNLTALTLTPEDIENAIAFGGKQLEVRYRAKDQPAGLVKVRLLEVDPSLIEYVARSQNELALADWICGQPEGWSKTLRPECVLEIAEVAHALNFHTAQRYAEHRAKVAEALLPINQRMEGLAARISGASAPASGS